MQRLIEQKNFVAKKCVLKTKKVIEKSTDHKEEEEEAD